MGEEGEGGGRVGGGMFICNTLRMVHTRIVVENLLFNLGQVRNIEACTVFEQNE